MAHAQPRRRFKKKNMVKHARCQQGTASHAGPNVAQQLSIECATPSSNITSTQRGRLLLKKVSLACEPAGRPSAEPLAMELDAHAQRLKVHEPPTRHKSKKQQNVCSDTMAVQAMRETTQSHQGSHEGCACFK